MKRSSKSAVLLPIAAAVCLVLTAGWTLGCQASYPRRDPTGEYFPPVEGTSLAGESISIPAVWAGEPVLLLVGFEQNTQFDLDRWALGLWQNGITLRVVEVPTIPGLVPSLISERIDDGMRSGIPEEDWASVVTVYEEAEAIALFTGNENPLPGRILLIDGAGRVVSFHDRGYSVGALVRISEAITKLKKE